MIIGCHIRNFKTLCCSYADAESGRIMEVRQQSGGSTTTSYTTLFLVKDHLGSVRAVTDSYGHVLERNSYYPFGLQTNQGESYPTLSGTLTTLYPNIISATSVKRDLYNGKEIQTVAGTDYLDYGFRQYDPVTARWMAVDPSSSKHKNDSPYVYCHNNSISFSDILGLDGVISSGSGTKEDPYIVTAVYFYINGSLNNDEIRSFQSALNDYNSDTYKTEKGYFRFNLSMKEVEKENITSEMEKTRIFNEEDGKNLYYGNYIKINEEESVYYGGGNCREIIIYRHKVSQGINRGMDRHRLLKGIFIHELGHNLGGTHEDGTETMSNIKEDVRDNENGRGKTDYSVYPKLKKKFIQIIINKIWKMKDDKDEGKIWKK